MHKEKELQTINSLLDIERFSGESQGRLGPMVIFLCVAGAPPLLYMYFLFGVVPITYVIPFFLIHIIRCWMVILGDEGARLKQYKQQLYDEYSGVEDIMNNKTIHEDGMIEYTSNKVAYLIVTTNNSHIEIMQKAQMVRSLLIAIPSSYNLSIYGQNVLDVDNLSSRYSGIKFFGDKESAREYLEIIDYNRKIIKEDTIIQRTIFVVTARKQNFKDLQRVLQGLRNSSEVRAFKTLTIADKSLAEDVLSRDLDTYIDFDGLNKKKYAKENYFDSHVVKYDYEDKTQDEVKEVKFKHEIRNHS